MTVTTPDNVVHNLFDDGQHSDLGPGDGIYGLNILLGTQVPLLGNYTFNVTDISGNSVAATDVLDQVIDVPSNMAPANNSIVNTSTPILSWDAVPGATVYWIEFFDKNNLQIWGRYNILTTSVQYNDDNNGVALVDGQVYQWQLQAQNDDGRSWHAPVSFVYSNSTDNPVVIGPTVYSMHRGDDYGNEGYGLELYVNVVDPQGPGDISSVTVTSPAGATYTLYDNGQNGDDEANNGRYGIHIWDFNQTPPPFGTYTFTVTDQGGHIISVSDLLENVLDYPRNVYPANNEIINGENLIFTWDAVPDVIEYGVSIRDNNNNHIWSGATNTNSIIYSGPAFTDGHAYRWNVGASRVIDASSWHDEVNFIFSSDPEKPIITYTQVYTVHDRFTNGNEQYRLELNADVADPQGITDVTVTVTAPGGVESYNLYDDGQHGDGNANDGRYSNYDLLLAGPPAIGDYTFTAMDGSGNIATVLDPLNSLPMIPGNMAPANNGYVSTSTPDYRWDVVPNATSYTIDVQDVNNINVWNRNNITSNTVQHNDDGIGTNLIEGHIYRWQLQAYTEEGRSWQEWLNFVYSSDGGSPVAENPSVQSRHWGRDQEYDSYGLEFRLNASDPQGLGAIVSVTVDVPGAAVYTLYDDGQHNDNGANDGYFGNNIWNLPDAPLTGEYIFIVTDADANTTTTSDILDNVIDIPRNAQPSNNSLVNSPNPSFSWTAVDGVTNYSVNVHDGTTQVWYKDNITSTSVQYNDNGSGQALVEGKTYYWNISTRLEDANSWNDENCFVFTTNVNNPIAINPSVQSRHWGRDQVYENYGLELRLNVIDPQGLGNIASVIVTAPGGTSYELFDDGQHADHVAGDGIFGNNIWNLVNAPVTGEYIFTVTNAQGFTDSKNDILNNVIDFPRNIQPAHNSFVTTATPTLSWNEVPGATSYWINVNDGNSSTWSLGGITGTSVVYNVNATGQALQEGKTYNLNVNAGLDDAISWHDNVTFTYSTNPDNPIASNALVRSMHRGDDQGNEGWALELYVNVADPQTLADIQSVIATSPGGVNYELFDNGQNGDDQANNGRFGIHIWEFTQTPPPLGEYIFTITDKASNVATASDNLDHIIDYPRNFQPANNTVVNSPIPVLSWNAVAGVNNYWVTVFDANNNQIWNQEVTGGTFVQYNGPELQEEVSYHWQVNTGMDDASSWHDWSYFAWANDPNKPFIGTSDLWYRHYGDDEGNDQYVIDLMARVNDPQGPDDVQTVTLTTPNSDVITLNKNEGDPGAWNGQWSSNVPPVLGDYIYTVTDLDGYTDTETKALLQAQDFPRNIHPVNNGFVSSATPTFTWDPVEGINSYHLTVYDINYNQLWNQDIPVGITSAVYNSDGLGQPLVEGSKYRWEISTWGDHSSTWHNPVSFTYSSSTENPIFTYANVFSINHGDNAGSEHAGLRLMADVNDPQGLGDIQSVTVTSPDFVTYTLYDDGQHGDDVAGDGRFGNYVWDPPQAPVPGTYSFDVTDISEHSGSSSDILDYILYYPRNIVPEYNGVMVPAAPEFSWNPVDYAESYFIYVYESNGWDVVWWKNGITDTTVIYNDNGTGLPLTEGKSYLWEIFATGYDGQSWHEASPFVYRSNLNRIIHVDIGNNSGTENGSADHPFNTIQEGIDASAGGDTVLVRAGTYIGNLTLVDKDIMLTSLFVNSGDENDISTTIIDGNHTGTALLIQNADVTVNGFTIQNGQASDNGAGGIQIEGGNSVVSHCAITRNNGIGVNEWGAGGLTFNNGYLQVINCILTENYSPGGASAIRAGGCSIDVINTLVANNSGTMAFHYNTVTGSIVNSTIANNSRGFGFNISPISVMNCIAWNNNRDYWGDLGNIRYSNTDQPFSGEGNISTNPVFMNPYAGDFHLQQNSPCIDAGDPDMIDANGSRNDMGYYGGQQGVSYVYLDGPPALNTITASPAYVSSGQVLTINASLFDAQTQISSVSADIENPDETVIASFALYDDGAHSDNNAGDGVFGNTVTYTWLSGQHYFIDLTASDNNSHLAAMNNVAGFDGINAPLMVDLPFTHELMSINGTGNESVWNTIAPVPVSKHHWGPIDSPADLSASYKACWNLDSLFVFIDVTDDSLDNVHGVSPWENDKISLYLDMDNSRGSSYDADDWDMTVVWEGGFNPNRPFSGFKYAHHTNAARDGYQLEMALSLKDLGFPMADLLGFDLDIMDRDGEDPTNTLLFWNSEINLNYQNPGLNGTARLMDYQENMPDQILKVLDIVDFPECGGSDVEIKVLLQNVGIALINEFDIAYSINGDTIYPVEKVNMQYLPGLAHQYTFTTHADLSVPGKYTINIFTLLDNGDPHANFGLIAEKTVFGTDPVAGWTTYGTCNGLPDNAVRYVMEDSQGNIWAGTSNGGVARLETASGIWTVFNSGNSGFTNNNAITLFEDHENKIWVGLDGSDGVAATFDGTVWTSNNPSNNHVLTMFEDHADNMWFGTWGENGIRKWDRASDTWTIINTQNSGLSSHDMWYGAIMEDSNNNMWFGTIGMNGPAGPGGLAKFDGNNWTVYNASNSGLPTNLIVGSLLDRNGNFWLAHGWENRGVTRFDGYSWMNFNTGNCGIAGNSVNSIFEDSNGNLWFATWGQGVSRFNGRTWITFNTDNSGLTSNNVNSITEDSNKDIWFGTSNGLCKYDAPDQAIKVIDVVDFPNCGTTDAAITVRLVNTGTLPVDQFDITYSINGTSIDPVETATVTLIPGETVSYTFSTHANLTATGNYTLYATTLLDGGDPLANEYLETQLFVFGSDTWEDWISHNMCNGMPAGNVRYVMEDSQGNIWAAINGTGVARLDTLTGTWTLFNSETSGFNNNLASALCEDHLGNIWVGLDGDGIVSMYDGTSWTSNNPLNTHVLTIMEDHAGNMWFGTWSQGVRMWDRTNDVWYYYTRENSGLPSNDMWYGAIMEDSEHNMWFATLGGGLAKFDRTTWTVYNSSNSGVPNNTYWGSMLDSEDNIWLAHGYAMNDINVNGVTKFDGTSWTTYNTANSGITHDKIFNIYEDNEGSIWFGSWDNGVSKFDGTNWENFTMANSGLTSNGVNSITQDHKGNMWFGTGRGIDEYVLESITPQNHFSTVWTGNGHDHMNFYATLANIDGVPMQPGDEIGIFDGEYCVGAGVLTEVLNGTNFFEIRVSRDEPATPEIDGYTIGHPAAFRLWDASEQREITAYDIIYTSGDNLFDIGISTWYQINGTVVVDQVIPLLNGWNIFSLHVTPDNASMMNIVQPLINEGSLVKIQNESGAAIEPIPGLGTWLDNIGNWSSTEGYKIRVNTTTNLTVTGRPITQPVDIDLMGGWNIIGYPSAGAQEAMTVLNELITNGNLMKVQDETGAAIEPMPMNAGWIDNIINFEPGEGYKVRVATDGVLTITPSGPAGGLKTAGSIPVSQHYQPAWIGNGYDHMNIYLSLIAESVSALQPGDEIAVYDGDLCVGTTVIQHQDQDQNLFSISASADDPATADKDGFSPGSSMSFKIWRAGDNSETEINTVHFYPGYSNKFEPMGTTVAGMKIPAAGITEPVTSLQDNYPNPFAVETTFKFTLGETLPVNIALYNMLGEQVKVLVSQTMESGTYTTIWDATDQRNNRVPPGIYLCKMIAGSFVAVKTVEVTQ